MNGERFVKVFSSNIFSVNTFPVICSFKFLPHLIRQTFSPPKFSAIRYSIAWKFLVQKFLRILKKFVWFWKCSTLAIWYHCLLNTLEHYYNWKQQYSSSIKCVYTVCTRFQKCSKNLMDYTKHLIGWYTGNVINASILNLQYWYTH